MDNNNVKTIREAVLEKIKSGQAIMRPRWQFILLTILGIAGIVILFLSVVYLLSFIIFSLDQRGNWLLPSFGFSGLGIFLTSLPWLLLLISVFFVALLEHLVRRYSFAYRKPLLYSLLIVMVLVLTASKIIAQTPMHKSFDTLAKESRLPIAGQLYRGQESSKNFHLGVIAEMAEESFIVINQAGREIIVITNERTKFPQKKELRPGDQIFIMGKIDNNKISAKGIVPANKPILAPKKSNLPVPNKNKPPSN